MRRGVTVLLGWLLAGCVREHDVSLSLRLGLAELEAHIVDLRVYAGACPDLVEALTGPIPPIVTRPFLAGDRPPAVGELEAGRYAFVAIVSSADCEVVGYGCDAVAIGEEPAVVIEVAPVVPIPACTSDERCERGRCVALPAGGCEAGCVASVCETAECVRGECVRTPIVCGDGLTCCNGECASDCGVFACAGRSVGEVCRTAAGECDVPERCNGVDPTCPEDGVRPSGAACRAARDACDTEETCAGGRDCPTDGFAAAGTPCAGGQCNGLGACLMGCTQGSPCATANPCERGEWSCMSTPMCMAVGPAPAGTPCRGAAPGGCDVAEVCDGAARVCPPDRFLPATHECRGATGPCDAEERCTGTGPDCPADRVAASGAVCRSASGACDVAERCDGTQKTCPQNAVARAGTSCRADRGDCDVAEVCNGTSSSCPADRFEADYSSCGTGCRRCVRGVCTAQSCSDGCCNDRCCPGGMM